MRFAIWTIIVGCIILLIYYGNEYLSIEVKAKPQATSTAEVLGIDDKSTQGTGDILKQEDKEPETDAVVDPEPARTPLSLPAKTKQTSDSEKTSSTPERDENGYLIVRYTDNGFVPFVSEVRIRETVRFINDSNKPMWVTSRNHPYVEGQEYEYPEFQQPKSVSRGGDFIFTFIKSGTWGYKNLNYEDHLGAVVVLP